jgi:hypothetical protein
VVVVVAEETGVKGGEALRTTTIHEHLVVPRAHLICLCLDGSTKEKASTVEPVVVR